VGHSILNADPAIDPIIHLGLGDIKSLRVLLAGKGRNSDNDHLVVTQGLSPNDVGLAGEDFRDDRHASYYKARFRDYNSLGFVLGFFSKQS
jgi:hypothetical protein